MDYYDTYFDVQTGAGARTGYGGISHVYIGSPNQRGHGIGSFLGGLFRRIIPLLKQGARTVGKEALRSGINMASDVVNSGVQPGEAFQTRLRESGQNLKRKAEEKINSLMKGSGYKGSKINKLMHSAAESASRRNSVKSKRKTVKSRKRSSGGNGGGGTRKKRIKKVKKSVRGRRASAKSRATRRNKKPRTVTDIFA